MVNVNGEMCLNGDLRSILVNTTTVWKEVGSRMGVIYRSRQQYHHHGTWWGR